jgi:GT2 family glycosyltransferase
MKNSVLLGYVSAGWVRSEFMNSILNAVSGPEADPAIGGVISSNAGPLLAYGRNLLVKQFLAHDKEWLCTIDTDIVFAPNTISRLLDVADAVERPVVSALYHIFWDGKKTPAAYEATIINGAVSIDNIHDGDCDDDRVIAVDAVGAGCLLIHRSVFENIQKRYEGTECWFREMVIDNKDHGEDISFCIRCAHVGARITLDSAVQVGHVKSAMLGKVT